MSVIEENFKDQKHYLKIGNYTDSLSDFNMADNANNDNLRDSYRKKIEPWLSAILQSDHLSLLCGTGLTQAICSIAEIPPASMNRMTFIEQYEEKIKTYANNSAKRLGRGNANIEDDIRTALELYRGLEIGGKSDSTKILGDDIDRVLKQFADSILSPEQMFYKNLIEDENGKSHYALQILKSFLLTFASRSATRDRLHIFTTNYDRFIEYGCDKAGINIIDRFLGKIEPVFQNLSPNLDYHYIVQGSKNDFRYVEGVVRYSKIHGSLDWIQRKNKIIKANLKFGAQNLEDVSDYKDQLMIFPNSMKSIETAYYPYSELFRDFSYSICRPNSSLITYGYGFGDSHINKIILEMLRVPSSHIVIISYSIDDRLKNFLQEINSSQVTLLCGSELGNLENLVRYYLPKSAIDNITSLASDILKRREGYSPKNDQEASVTYGEENE
jgi:hypothetical protein